MVSHGIYVVYCGICLSQDQAVLHRRLPLDFKALRQQIGEDELQERLGFTLVDEGHINPCFLDESDGTTTPFEHNNNSPWSTMQRSTCKSRTFARQRCLFSY